MSHDRGCHCGREPYEYIDCVKPDCVKKVKSVTQQIKEYAEKSNERERTMIKKEHELYVWIRSDGKVSIIDDPVEVYQRSDFDKAGDHIHLLGEEVEVRVTVEVKKKKPVYRENASGYRTPFENRD